MAESLLAKGKSPCARTLGSRRVRHGVHSIYICLHRVPRVDLTAKFELISIIWRIIRRLHHA